MSRKKVVHVIDDLGQGGAETLLVDLLPGLASEYEVVLVTLGTKIEFAQEQLVCSRRISLGFQGVTDVLKASKKLNKLILQEQPDIVRSQLYWSTIVTRLACPSHIPFFFSVHATMNEDPIIWYKKQFLRILEKVTYKRWQHMIGVTQAVIDSFKQIHPRHGRTFLLQNYVRNAFFCATYSPTYDGQRPLRLVAVSNIRLIKNIPYLVEALRFIPQDQVALDIYGDGPLRDQVEQQIARYGLANVKLKGRHSDIATLLTQYDLFVSPSTVEGFGIAVAEAMSVGLPVIISDIPVYREIAADKALYLDNQNPKSLKAILDQVIAGRISLQDLSKSNKVYAQSKFSKGDYLLKLKAIYQSLS